ncbi:uncharacterized protein LOC119676065 [Teleopsis dalmanni]|nr:uncharacterized protein LOC119676065 [Teleopsis dalmanni]
MDPNKFYCRNAAQSTASTSSISSATSSSIGCGGNSNQEYIGACGSSHSSSGFSCKELLARNANSKSLLNQRGTNAATGFGGSASSTSGYCSSNSSGTGNYINVMPVPVGTLQYQRRKLTPQEYQ